MSRIKQIALHIWRLWYMKYAVVAVCGVLIVGFLDENSVLSHVRNKQRISELREEIEDYEARYQRDQSQIRQLDKDPKAMEKIARERYFMKSADEDIFILSDDKKE